MSGNEDISTWWIQGLQKKMPGRKRSKSESVLLAGSDSEKENHPIGNILEDSFGSHSFDEGKRVSSYKRKNMKWGNPMKQKEDKNKDQRNKQKMEKQKAVKAEHERLTELLGNPMDDFNLDTIKRLTVHLYLKLWDDFSSFSKKNLW